MANINPGLITFQPAEVTFLEMHEKPQPISKREDVSFHLLKKPVPVKTYRQYYYGVGEKYFWLDRMVMADEELAQKINAPNIDIYVMYMENEVAGYAEFLKEKDYTEIVYFGLMPAFVGKGIGKYFLQWVIEQAWSYAPKWIQLNTCTLDHSNALPVYKSAGFKEIRKEIQLRRVLRN